MQAVLEGRALAKTYRSGDIDVLALRGVDIRVALLRTAVEAELAPGERSRLHARAARLQTDAGASVERIALHLLETEPRADATTARLLLDASRSALCEHRARPGPIATGPTLYRTLVLWWAGHPWPDIPARRLLRSVT